MVDADALAPNERQGISNHHAAKTGQHGDTGNARQKLCLCAGEIWGDLPTLNYTISQLHLRLLCEFTIGTCPLCKSNNLSDLMTSWRGYMVFKTYHSRWIREGIAGGWRCCNVTTQLNPPRSPSEFITWHIACVQNRNGNKLYFKNHDGVIFCI